MAKDIFKNSANPNEAENFYKEFSSEFKKNHHKAFQTNKDNHSFLKIFGNSPFLCRFIITNTWVYEQYQNSSYLTKEKPLSQFTNEVKSIVNTHQNPTSTLKKYKYQEYLRLTIRELLGLDQEVTYREFSFLATAITSHYLTTNFDKLITKNKLDKEAIGDYAVIALGKLGGCELNYSSDIDIVGLYEKDGTSEKITNHEFFSNLFTQTGFDLSQNDQDGFFFRVDWDLRPEGKTGVLANSLGAMERYYQTFGEEWERQAYIKGSPLFQNTNLGDRFLSMLKPFVYRKYFDEKTIHNIWDIKSRISQESQDKEYDGINLKCDHGGIRDIEFFIQGFQLLYGGKFPAIQEQNTLMALKAIETQKFITAQTVNVLKQSYLFLRRMESCIQMENEQQTHVFKSDAGHKFKIARRMGFTNNTNEAVEILEENLLNVQSAVKRIFDEVYEK